MPLQLSINNFDRLSDGGPLTFTMRGQSRAEIGRDAHLDWCLPDPERIVSGKHCEISRTGADYDLIDLSTNGTYVNGSGARMHSPYRLKSGDELRIGDYLISVALVHENEAFASDLSHPPPTVERPASYDALWDIEGIAPPADPKEFRRAVKKESVQVDFLYHAAAAPRVSEPQQFSPKSTAEDFAAAPPPEDLFRVPAPRRRKIEEVGWDDALPPEMAPSSPPLPAAAERRTSPSETPSIWPVGSQPPSAFLGVFEGAAGLPEGFFANRDAMEIAEILGRSMRVVVEELKRLLQARAQTKNLARSTEHTVIEPRDNNPLKFAPTPEDALRIMFASPSPSYLGAERALEQGFADLGRHQAQCFSAMQQAVRCLLADLNPAKIEAATPAQGGVIALVKSQKSALWDAYVAAWRAGNGAEDVIQRFMLLFGQNYDRSG